jgi:hypothetical protein
MKKILFFISFLSFSACQKDIETVLQRPDISHLRGSEIDDSNDDTSEIDEDGFAKSLFRISNFEYDKVEDTAKCTKYRGYMLFDNTSDAKNIVKIKGVGFGSTQGTSTVTDTITTLDKIVVPLLVKSWSDTEIIVELQSASDATKNVSMKISVSKDGRTAKKSLKAVGTFRGIASVSGLNRQEWYGSDFWECCMIRTLNGLASYTTETNKVTNFDVSFTKFSPDYEPKVGDVLHKQSGRIAVITKVELATPSKPQFLEWIIEYHERNKVCKNTLLTIPYLIYSKTGNLYNKGFNENTGCLGCKDFFYQYSR